MLSNSFGICIYKIDKNPYKIKEEKKYDRSKTFYHYQIYVTRFLYNLRK